MSFIAEVYKLTRKFPQDELYGLTSQLRRASVSVALNIAEGSACSEVEFRRFLSIAHRSNYETMCALEIAQQLHYCTLSEMEELLRLSEELSAMLSGLQKKLALKPL